MATVITSECINCGACEPECPNTAIYQGGVEWQAPDGAMHAAISNDIFYIVPEKCTECVGFYDQEACAKVCPVDCCVPDPERPESEALLLVRARALHPDKTIPDDVPFRYFRAGVVFSCPHCQGTFVPTLSMVRGVEEALAQFHARWRRAFEQFHERRRRELEQFEERERVELEQFSAELRAIATREKAPGAPAKRKGFFSF